MTFLTPLRNIHVLQDSNTENLVKYSLISKIQKPSTIYMISGTILNYALCSWLLSGTSMSSKTPTLRTWSNLLWFHKFKSLELFIWCQEPSWIMHDVLHSSQEHPYYPWLQPGELDQIFQSLTLSTWSQETSWSIHDIIDSSQECPCHPRLQQGKLGQI